MESNSSVQIKIMIDFQAQCLTHKKQPVYVCIAETCTSKRLLCQLCRSKDHAHFLQHGKQIYSWQQFLHFSQKQNFIQNLQKILSKCKKYASSHKSHYEKQINMLKQDFSHFKTEIIKAIENFESEMLNILYLETNKFDYDLNLIQSELQNEINQQNPEKTSADQQKFTNESIIESLIHQNKTAFKIRGDLMILREKFAQAKTTRFFYSQTDNEGCIVTEGSKYIQNSVMQFFNYVEDYFGWSSSNGMKRSFSTEQKTPNSSNIEINANAKFFLPQILPSVKKVLKNLPELQQFDKFEKIKTHNIYIPTQGIFTGQIKEGMREGWGRFIFNDGSIYEGEWKNDNLNGFGRIVSKSSYYEGEIVDGKAQGIGKYENNKLIYDGSWKKDKREGFGRQQYKKKKWVYIGQFLQNEYEGKGELINKDFMFKGTFRKGKFHGCGILFHKTKQVYEGTFDNGKMMMGQLHYPDGSFYSGMFENNRPHGTGSYTWNDGLKYEGCWKNGKQDGTGIQIFENETERRGVWKEGEWVNWI